MNNSEKVSEPKKLKLKIDINSETEEKIFMRLKSLGLTKYETLAYISLIRIGEQSVAQLIEKTKIPQPKAYGSLKALVTYGLIQEKIGRGNKTFKRFRAISPEIGIENFFGYFQNLKKEIIEELNSIKNNYNDTSSGLWEIVGRENILMTARNTINNAKNEILIIASFQFLKEIAKELISASKKKVYIHCISNFETINNTVDEKTILEWSDYFLMRKRKAFSMPYIIEDRTKAFQWNKMAFTNPIKEKTSYIAQIVEQKESINTLIDHFFFSNWNIGKPTSLFISSSTLPQTFVHLKTAIEVIDFYLQKNIHPIVLITGFYTKNRNTVTIRGEVIRTEISWSNGIFSIIIKPENSNREISVGGAHSQYEEISAEEITILSQTSN